MVLYDLQQDLEGVASGVFKNGAFIVPIGPSDASVTVEPHGNGKTVKITGRKQTLDGVSILLPRISTIQPGDKLTVSGRLGGEGRPTHSAWCMCMRSPRGAFNEVTQQSTPGEVFSMYYIIDKIDMPHPLYVHSNSWGGEAPLMDIYIDSITVTRSDNISMRQDNRQLVYNLESDDIMASYHQGDIFYPDPDNPLAPTGSPTCVIKRHGYSNAIYVANRKNDYDGLDIRLNLLGLMSGNSYTIHVVGRLESDAPPETEMMLQIIPGYSWRDNHRVESHKDFTLGHTLTLMELETADVIRIATNAAGKNADFSINSIEVTTEEWNPFIF